MVVLQLQKSKNIFAHSAPIYIEKANSRIIIVAGGDCRADHLNNGQVGLLAWLGRHHVNMMNVGTDGYDVVILVGGYDL